MDWEQNQAEKKYVANIRDRIKFIAKYINFCSKFKISPFVINKCGQFHLISGLGQFAWLVLIIGTYFRFLSLSFLLFKYISGRIQAQFVDFVLLVFYTLVYLMSAIIHSEIIFKRNLFVYTLNQFFKIQCTIEGNYDFTKYNTH